MVFSGYSVRFWVFLFLLLWIMNPAFSFEPFDGCVTGPDEISLRSHAKEDSSILCQIPGHGKLKIQEINNRPRKSFHNEKPWVQVSFDKKTGWLQGKEVSIFPREVAFSEPGAFLKRLWESAKHGRHPLVKRLKLGMKETTVFQILGAPLLTHGFQGTNVTEFEGSSVIWDYKTHEDFMNSEGFCSSFIIFPERKLSLPIVEKFLGKPDRGDTQDEDDGSYFFEYKIQKYFIRFNHSDPGTPISSIEIGSEKSK